MGIDAYVDSIIELLVEQGGIDRAVAEAERDGLAMAFMKGRDWTQVAIQVLKRHNIDVR